MLIEKLEVLLEEEVDGLVHEVVLLLERKGKVSTVERTGSGVERRTLDYEKPGSNPVLRC